MIGLSSNAMAVLLGLLAAGTWGAADFAGGLATRKAAPSRVVLIAHGVSFLLLLAASAALPAVLPAAGVLSGLTSGVTGGVALMLFYEALSLGAMGLAAALAGLLTAVLPVVIAIRTEGAPAPVQVAGFALAAAAIVLIAYAPAPPGTATGRKALVFAMVAGCGFGLQLVLLHLSVASGEHGGAGTLVRALTLSRMGGVCMALVAQGMTLWRGRRRLLPEPSQVDGGAWVMRAVSLPVLATLAGLLDTAGNGLYMLSSLSGRLDVAAVLSSLYPGGTIVLAALFLRERATRLQAVGMGLALGAVALIAA
ncbi:transporter [Acidipila sp. EB88]|uniref:EamA family transporter n=1 Tax=Acidipila sp. EB88 TaxID=2305226 RepID=UPI000F5FCE64|nr:transporter [Acidipila sp. EB88]